MCIFYLCGRFSQHVLTLQRTAQWKSLHYKDIGKKILENKRLGDFAAAVWYLLSCTKAAVATPSSLA